MFTLVEGFEVMCHVSTLLPYRPNDAQQVRCLSEGSRDARPRSPVPSLFPRVPVRIYTHSSSASATLATTFAPSFIGSDRPQARRRRPSKPT